LVPNLVLNLIKKSRVQRPSTKCAHAAAVHSCRAQLPKADPFSYGFKMLVELAAPDL